MTLVSGTCTRDDRWKPRFETGDVVANKYRVERLVGRGGMAWVFEATHLWLPQRVALKVLRIDTSTDNTEALTRFRREARAAASVSGEATVRVLDVGTLPCGSPFLVMEYLEGRDLESVIDRKTCLPVAVAVDYALQACEGLAETHAAGIVHRDLKPSNLFLTRTPDGSVRVKLLDFGISKFADPSMNGHRVTGTREIVGSPVYMSPEQMRSSEYIDQRSDIWSMGVILYELLAHGQSPFAAPTLAEICARVLDHKPMTIGSIRRRVPRALEGIVFRCLEKQPARRFQTVADLASALAPFGPPDARRRSDRIRRLVEESSVGSAPVPHERPRWRRRVSLAVSVAVAGMITLSVALGSRTRGVQAAAMSPMRAPYAPERPLESSSLSAGPMAMPEPVVLVGVAPETTPFPGTTPTARTDSAPRAAGPSAGEPRRRTGVAARTAPPKARTDGAQGDDIPEFGERE
jgi:serine/threonine-protein kinase